MARSSLTYILGFSVKFFFQPIYTDYANISAKYGSNPSSGSWEEVCFTYFPLGRYVNLCPPLVAILDFQSVQKETTLG
jgi:hypothetical protein